MECVYVKPLKGSAMAGPTHRAQPGGSPPARQGPSPAPFTLPLLSSLCSMGKPQGWNNLLSPTSASSSPNPEFDLYSETKLLSVNSVIRSTFLPAAQGNSYQQFTKIGMLPGDTSQNYLWHMGPTELYKSNPLVLVQIKISSNFGARTATSQTDTAKSVLHSAKSPCPCATPPADKFRMP